jgi:hypothetical protein
MNYKTFPPHPDLEALIKCYWTLEVPKSPDTQKQRIVPDGFLEMFFILGDDVKRYTSEKTYIIQPRSMILGQITEPFFIEPVGAVNSFAVRFYPYGFAPFATISLKEMANKETELSKIFGENNASKLTKTIVSATTTQQRINIVEDFFLDKLKDTVVIDNIVKSAIDSILLTKGSQPVSALLKGDASKRRQLERKFSQQVGLSTKQLGKIIRLQAALKMLLQDRPDSLTAIAIDSMYFDQSHFIKDFKEFTGVNPKEFYKDDAMVLSSLLYSKD